MRTVTGLLQIAAVCLCAGSLSAGVVFDFVAEAPNFKYSGTMMLEGPNSRTDINSGAHPLFNPNITLITRKEGTDVVVVDHSRKTYFQRYPPTDMRGPLATAGGFGKTTLKNSRVTKSRDRIQGEGRPLERYAIRADYDIDIDLEGEKMNGSVVLEAEMDVDPEFEQRAFPWGLQYGAKTGFQKLDWAIASRLPNRLPMRQVVKASRQIAGGPTITETFSITVSNVREQDVDDKLFYAPGGYKYEEPVFSFGQ